jgi:hypothetical protein
MKKALLLAILVVLIIGLSGCTTSSKNAQPQSPASDNSPPMTTPPATTPPAEPTEDAFLAYQNQGITIEHPKDWEVKENQAGAIVAFMSPSEGWGDSFSENVNVFVENLTAPMSLEEYGELSIKNAPKLIQNFNLLKTETATIGNVAAQKMEYTGDVGANSLHFLAYSLVTCNKVYTITYTAQKDNFQKNLRAAEKIIQSFEIQVPDSTAQQAPLDINAVKQNALEISWQDLMRYNEKYVGKIVHLEGIAIQVTEEKNSVNCQNDVSILFSIDEFGQELVIAKFKNYNSIRILENDNIAIWGKVQGLDKYTTVLGTENTVSLLEGQYVELIPTKR